MSSCWLLLSKKTFPKIMGLLDLPNNQNTSKYVFKYIHWKLATSRFEMNVTFFDDTLHTQSMTSMTSVE